MRPSAFAASVAALLSILHACSEDGSTGGPTGGAAGVGGAGGWGGSGVGGGSDSGAEPEPDSSADGATDATGEADGDSGPGDVSILDAESSVDSGSICAGLNEAQCSAIGVPCVALQGKLVQDGGVGYAGCWTAYWPTADGGWYPKDFAAIQSCAIDTAGACWVFGGAFAPDGWKLLPSCNDVPACAGVLGDP